MSSQPAQAPQGMPPETQTRAGRTAGRSQRLVAAVAERTLLRTLAAAQPDGFRFFRDEDHRRQPAALVTAVAERLGRASSTSAPGVLPARFDLHRERRVPGDDG